jgi:hypothetical protein
MVLFVYEHRFTIGIRANSSGSLPDRGVRSSYQSSINNFQIIGEATD